MPRRRPPRIWSISASTYIIIHRHDLCAWGIAIWHGYRRTFNNAQKLIPTMRTRAHIHANTHTHTQHTHTHTHTHRLSQDRLYDTLPVIMVTARGHPDLATRAFCSKLVVRWHSFLRLSVNGHEFKSLPAVLQDLLLISALIPATSG